MRSLVLLLALCLIAACDSASGGDGKSCTLIGCAGGLNIDFVRSPWPAGAYSVSVKLDGSQHALCAVELPFATATSSATCNAPDVTLGTSGQMLPTAQHAITGLRIGGMPKTVHVEITRNGVLEMATDLTPTYLTSRPNGPGCEPLCTQANVNLTVP